MSRYLFSFVIAIGILTTGMNTFGQQQTGCLYNNRLYYQPNGSSGGFPNYKTTPNITLASAFCVVNIGGTCRVNKKKNQQGVLRTFYLVQCPIDDYIPILILLVGGFGLFKLREQKTETT